MIGEEISVSKAAIAAIALAAWRLHRKYIVSSGLDHKVPLTFGLQKIIRELKSAGIEFVEFDNVPSMEGWRCRFYILFKMKAAGGAN